MFPKVSTLISMVYFEVQQQLIKWPSEIVDFSELSAPMRIASLIRLQQWSRAEAECLSSLSSVNMPDRELYCWLLCLLYCNNFMPLRAFAVYSTVIKQASELTLPWAYLKLRIAASDSSLFASSGQINLSSDPVVCSNGEGIFSSFYRIMIAFCSNNLSEVNMELSRVSNKNTLEYYRFYSRYLLAKGDCSGALGILTDIEARSSDNYGFWIQFCETALHAQDSSLALHSLRTVHYILGDHHRVLPLLIQVKLLQRQPSLARRSTYLLRSRRYRKCDESNVSISNQLTSVEACGNVEWFSCLLRSYRSIDMLSFADCVPNMIYHLASIESSLSVSLAGEYFSALNLLSSEASRVYPQAKNGISTSSMRIAWVTPDVSPHPVSRFLYSFLSASQDILGNTSNILVSTSSNKPTESWLLGDFAQLRHVEVLNLGSKSYQHGLEEIRGLDCDVAVDLAGWTGGNYQKGFAERLAPVQVNYLGYFASTGNPSIDYWLGDRHLFPTHMCEYHSEKIERLDRCFLAWNPTELFAEGKLGVARAPTGPVRFGSFNHNRKLSDRTLKVWGRLLSKMPDSRLVLKANAITDPDTQTLLRRRMLRQGLNPDQVIWLPLAASHEEHLMQYAEVDIALDCFPNGGCTTTCEALWMGVPVVTKTGNSYVSRMSTAVLHGANMSDWCADSDESYIDLAIQKAVSFHQLRDTREMWRSQVQNSPLGDAADLMRHLVDRFQVLRAKAL